MTDHAARAKILISHNHTWQEGEGSTDATEIASILEAQVHATLALVEHQRVTNIIAYVMASSATIEVSELKRLNQEIADTLGITLRAKYRTEEAS